MECAPTPRTAVTHVVVPAASARLTQPAMLTPPFLKVTVPVGVGPAPVTTAVKVTGWPKTEGFAEEVTVVVDADKAPASTIPRRRMRMLSATAKNVGTTGWLVGLNRKAGSRLYQGAILLDWHPKSEELAPLRPELRGFRYGRASRHRPQPMPETRAGPSLAIRKAVRKPAERGSSA